VIVVNVKAEIDPANLVEMQAGIAKMEELSRAEQGCQDYTFSIEINDSTMLRITEKWDSMEDLLAHFQVAHMADFQAMMAKYPPKSMDANFYEATAVTPPGM
jgi:quinol monooxygenase YgiN